MTADWTSRKFNDNIEWQLSPSVFKQVISLLGFKPEIDLFATYLNHQLDKYVAWKPDPGAVATDAFSLSWKSLEFYCFPLFSVIGRVISKIIDNCASGIIVIPLWETQFWFPLVLKHLIDCPVLLPQSQKLLQLPFNKSKVHPLYPKLRMAAVHLSFRQSIENKRISAEVKSIIIDSWRKSTRSRYESTLRRWEAFCIQRNSDPFLSSANNVLEFLNELHNSGCQYSALCTSHSALASVVTI